VLTNNELVLPWFTFHLATTGNENAIPSYPRTDVEPTRRLMSTTKKIFLNFGRESLEMVILRGKR